MGNSKLFKELRLKNTKQCSQSPRFAWSTPVNEIKNPKIPPVAFNKPKEEKKRLAPLDAKGSPDLKEIRKNLNDKMKKFRNGF